MPVVAKPDAFNAALLASPPLVVTVEQQSYIQRILERACSDSRFAEKAYIAIWKVLTGGNAIPPVVGSLDPASAVLGDPSFTLRVLGTGFTPGSIIIFNGGEEPTTFVSAEELTTGVDMSTVVVPITVPIAVLNPDGVQSDPASFEFTEAPVAFAASAPAKSTPVVSQKK